MILQVQLSSRFDIFVFDNACVQYGFKVSNANVSPWIQHNKLLLVGVHAIFSLLASWNTHLWVAGHWEGGQERSWWCHRGSQGMQFLVNVSSVIHVSGVPSLFLPCLVMRLLLPVYSCNSLLSYILQESPMPDSSSLFDHVYAKGFGAQVSLDPVSFTSSCVICYLC